MRSERDCTKRNLRRSSGERNDAHVDSKVAEVTGGLWGEASGFGVDGTEATSASQVPFMFGFVDD